MHEIKRQATQFWIIVSPVLLLKLLKKKKRKTKTLSTLCFPSFFFFCGNTYKGVKRPGSKG